MEEKKESFFGLSGTIGRRTYFIRFAVLVAIFLLVGFGVGWGRSFAAGLTMIVLIVLLLVQSIKRSRDAFGSSLWCVALLIPAVNSLALGLLLFSPSRKNVEPSN